jgi:hypothetical protein
MGEMPATRALLGIDVIASASSPGYHRDRLWGALTALLSEALRTSGLTPDEVASYETTGDGALYTFPDHRLGVVVDLAQRLDELAAERNRWHKPDIRVRVAIEVGAVGDGPAYFSPKVDTNRLLDAPAFKSLVVRCIAENTDQRGLCSVNSGLVLSDAAFRGVFGGAYTTLVRETDFVALSVVNKEFSERAWVRIPGVDARTLAEYASEIAQPDTEPDTGSFPVPPMRVTNTVSGNMKNSVQAGVVYGGVNLGGGRS